MPKHKTSLEAALVKEGWVVSEPKVATNNKTGEAVLIIGDEVMGLKAPLTSRPVHKPYTAFRPVGRKKVTLHPSGERTGTAVLSKNEGSNRELIEIAEYAADELKKLNGKYKGDILKSMKALVAVHIGHRILSMEDYDAIPPRQLDVIFKPFGTTFKQIERDIEKDLMGGVE